MHSYYPYWASARSTALENRSFVIGLEVPDLLNDYRQSYKTDDLSFVRSYYTLLQKDCPQLLPDFDVFFADRVAEKERLGCTYGMHFGEKFCPDVKFFWDWLPDSEKNKPFWRGYLWHLIVDATINPIINVETKINEYLNSVKIDNNIPIDILQNCTKSLETDWKKINYFIIRNYPEVQMTPEVKYLGTNIVIKIPDMSLSFIDWDAMKLKIDYLRKFDPLAGNIDESINRILGTS